MLAPFQDLEHATQLADAEIVKCRGTADYREGVAHFVEKRKPEIHRGMMCEAGKNDHRISDMDYLATNREAPLGGGLDAFPVFRSTQPGLLFQLATRSPRPPARGRPARIVARVETRASGAHSAISLAVPERGRPHLLLRYQHAGKTHPESIFPVTRRLV